jgi:hypothetical protein
LVYWPPKMLGRLPRCERRSARTQILIPGLQLQAHKVFSASGKLSAALRWACGGLCAARAGVSDMCRCATQLVFLRSAQCACCDKVLTVPPQLPGRAHRCRTVQVSAAVHDIAKVGTHTYPPCREACKEGPGRSPGWTGRGRSGWASGPCVFRGVGVWARVEWAAGPLGAGLEQRSSMQSAI